MSSEPSAGQPYVSLVLPNRDNETVLGLVLDRLAENTTYPRVELVAVDDGSTDASRQILRRWRDEGRFASFKLLEREHGGAIEALNAGLQAAEGDVVVQLDADASIETPGWIERMLPLLLLDERVGVVTGKIVMDSGLIHACGVNLIGPDGFHDRPSRITESAGRRTLHQRVERFHEGTTEEERALAEVDSGIGCCMMYRRADALAAGGYDTGFSPVWFDDLDLCLSIRKRGKKVFFTPDVRVIHQFELRVRRPVAPVGAPHSLVQRAWRVAARAGSRLSQPTRAAMARRVGLGRLRHHYAYWREKWGWDMLNPDLEEVRRRHGDSEVCWALEPERKAAGEALIDAFQRAGSPLRGVR